MNKISLSSFSALLGLALLLERCSGVMKTLGLERQAPDEFAVTPSEAPLDMPPDFFVLPTPTPGAPRPQDPSATDLAFKELTGKTSPTRPGVSSGESALLQMAGAESGQDQIRAEVDSESRIEKIEDQNLLQRLGFQKGKRPGKALNPYEEAEELQKKGVPTTPAVPSTDN